MTSTIKVRRIGAGHYEIHTPYGTFLLDNCPIHKGELGTEGLRCGPRWMLTYPGEYRASAAFDTKRDGVQQVKDVLAWELRNTTAADLADTRRNYHADNSPWTKAPTTMTETPAACSTHAIADKRGAHTEALPVPPCQHGTSYGVWDEYAGGFTLSVDCAMDAANWAAEQLDDDQDGEMSIKAICREHEEQPADSCEDCYAELADDADEE